LVITTNMHGILVGGLWLRLRNILWNILIFLHRPCALFILILLWPLLTNQRVPHGILWLVHVSFFLCFTYLPPVPIWIYHLDVNCTCHVIVQMTCGTFLLVHMDPQKFHFQVTRGSLSCFHITILTGCLASYGLATWHPFDFWSFWPTITSSHELHLRRFLHRWKALIKVYTIKSFSR